MSLLLRLIGAAPAPQVGKIWFLVSKPIRKCHRKSKKSYSIIKIISPPIPQWRAKNLTSIIQKRTRFVNKGSFLQRLSPAPAPLAAGQIWLLKSSIQKRKYSKRKGIKSRFIGGPSSAIIIARLWLINKKQLRSKSYNRNLILLPIPAETIIITPSGGVYIPTFRTRRGR